MCFTPLIFLIPGAAMFFWPDFVWRWTEGWRFKDVEPSDLAIKELQVRGAFIFVVGIILGVVILFSGR